jgi:chromosomal replication initiator protein
MSEIAMAACKYFKIEPIEMYSKRKTGNVVYARQIAFYICKNKTTHSYPEIGRRFGGRDHTTILHGVKKIGRLVKEDWRVCYDVAYVEAML